MEKYKVYIFNKSSRAAAYGVGTYMDQLISCLKTENIDFGVIHMHSSGNEVSIEEIDGYQKIHIPNLRGVNHTNYSTYARNVVYLLRDIIPKQNNIKYIFHLNFMTDPALALSLKQMFKCKVVLVAHYTNWSFSLMGDASKLNVIMRKKQKKRLSNFERNIQHCIKEDAKMIQICDHFICVAQHTYDVLEKVVNIKKTMYSIINNGLKDTYTPLSIDEKLGLRKKYFIHPESKIIFFAGRLDDVKGLSALIKSFKLVLQKYPEAHLFIAGDGNYSKWLVEADSYWHKITFMGRINKQQLSNLYNLADVGVITSIHEEFGYVALEMMMHQLPMVVTATGGLDEIIEDNITGLKVPVNIINDKRCVCEESLAKKIDVLLKDPKYAQRIGENARMKFLTQYEMSSFKTKMLNMYKKL